MTELIIIFAAAAFGGLLASLLKQPVILGYLLAGVIVGPFELGLIGNYEEVETIAELGVTFLLFTIGVEFSFAELNKVKKIALGGGGLQLLITISLTALVAVVAGWVTTVPQGIFLGELVSLSSTAVVIKALAEQDETSTSHGQVMLGILIVQDLALGLMLAILPALNSPIEQLGIAIGIALLKLALFALGAFVVGKWLIPPYLQLLAKTESHELFLLGVVTLCLGIALLTGRIGLSTEMGAFVAGLMISEVEYSDQTLDYVEPIRDICAAAFFAAIGVLIDPVFLWNNLPLILGLVSFVLIGKSLIVAPLVVLFRYPLKTAIIAGLGLAQIGEFSFVLAGQGSKFGLISENVYSLILGTTAVTLIVTPFVLRWLPALLEKAESLPWFAQADGPLESSDDVTTLQDHIVVCGYGRVGSNIVKLLLERNYPVLVIEQSEQYVQKLRDAKIPYIFGNAASALVLDKAGVTQARGMAIALPDPMSIRLCLKRSLMLNPELDLVVRASTEKDIEPLYQMGAKEVVQPEFEASLELSTHLFSGLGIPLAAIQQTIQQIRDSHYSTLRPQQTKEQIFREIKEATRTMATKLYFLPPESVLLGKTLGESHLRSLTGVIVMAITRANGDKIDYPDAETRFEVGDSYLLVGEANELAAFKQLASGPISQLPMGSDSSLWIPISKESPVVGMTLSQLELRDHPGTVVQAIRRKGAYLRFPDEKAVIQAGDKLLAFGSVAVLSDLEQKIAPASKIQTLVSE
ncbi:cation:proton antiporter [Synechococcus sp. ATX 2A4]|uniref:cation:proton antiporter domain-containing protein n=1 Tax=Synechococcus sp. ATX 2A4 TaxID=2823727 RepID=UPI0020CFB9AE|nr:cation:proton antiporter [Synechococcus sp. ATX 2A4]MCP9883576.1 cation:proton antiporter [Synechococcus sp. ATX 2A4]